jgi:hypothetical protein
MHRLHQSVRYAWSVLALCAFSSTVAAESIVVTLASGHIVTGELVSWSTDRIEMTVGGRPQAFTPAKLLGVRRENAPTPSEKFASHIELTDESHLPVSDFVVKDRIAAVATQLSEEPLKVPADQIRLVKWVDAEVDLPPPNATGDCVAVIKKDSSDTEILTGIIGDISAEQVEFTWEGETLPVKRSKIAALSFFQKESESFSAEPLCYLKLASGARLASKGLKLNGDIFEVNTVSGLNLQIPLADLIDADYSAGKLSYLGDMNPLRSKWTPLVEMPAAAESIRNFGAPRMNISFTGSQLALLWPGKDGAASTLEPYNKGLALRSRTDLEYRLPKGMRRFVAIAGIDPETLSQGDVLLRIEADADPVFEQTISGSDPPVEIDANIAGAQKLRIFVDYGGNLDLGDRLHLVEARLVK